MCQEEKQFALRLFLILMLMALENITYIIYQNKKLETDQRHWVLGNPSA